MLNGCIHCCLPETNKIEHAGLWPENTCTIILVDDYACHMQKLVLEVMVLKNLTTRDVFNLMHVTLAASEIRCADGQDLDALPVRHDAKQQGEDSRMRPLYQCGLAALRALNQEALVSNFDDNAGAHIDLRRGCQTASCVAPSSAGFASCDTLLVQVILATKRIASSQPQCWDGLCLIVACLWHRPRAYISSFKKAVVRA